MATHRLVLQEAARDRLGGQVLRSSRLAADSSKHHVVLKVLRPGLAPAIGGHRFLQEVTLSATPDRPHILPLRDSGEMDGTPFHTMPYAGGESLRDRLGRDGQLPLGEALQLTREIADALSHAHSRRIIHRSIKPENILLAGRSQKRYATEPTA